VVCCLSGVLTLNWIPLNRRKWPLFKPVLTQVVLAQLRNFAATTDKTSEDELGETRVKPPKPLTNAGLDTRH
jgi:hypothetical protein